MNTKFADSLSTRAKNGLTGAFGNRDIIYQPERIAAGRGRHTRARNIGLLTLQEIAMGLHKIGLIDNPDTWLGSKI